MNGELKPCPFCGGEATISVHDNHYQPCCANDNCIAADLYNEWLYPRSYERAVREWNTRAERTCENVHLFSGFRCNECKTTWHTLMRDEAGDWQKTNPKFCPNCGAKVTGAKEVDDER